MRITCFLILVLTLQSTASLWSQTTNMNVTLKNSTLRELFMHIEERSNYRFFYNNEDVNINEKISVEAENKSIATILTLAFDGLPYSFKEMENRVILVERVNSIREPGSQQQRRTIKGTVRTAAREPLPGATVLEKGTNNGTITNSEGNYSISVAEKAILVVSFIGMRTQEIPVAGKNQLAIVMEEETVGVDEVVVVGYGIQKKSDITGTVSSLGQERLEMKPNLNIAQAIQGAVPGVMISTSSAGAVSNENIMIRGRNSINASNDPLMVIDGIPYSGSLKDLNPNDVKSIDILKDASAAAIYGSRGANGVILITTKTGKDGKPKISYDGYYSVQSFVKLPDTMNGEEFYNFKNERSPGIMTQSEQEIYESGKWTDWMDLAIRNGNSTEHNLSVSGGFNNTNYYISGGVLNVRGLAVNDDYLRLTSRINIDTKITDWLTIGTRTQLSYDDRGGISPTFDGDNGVFLLNPLTKAYDEKGNLSIYPWAEDVYFGNALQGTLATNTDETNQVISNNYAIVKFPFIPGLQYRINAGLKIRFRDTNTYYGLDTKTGYEDKGNASTERYRDNSAVIENIVDYNREFGKHKLFVTGVYSFESNKNRGATVTMTGFPHDFLTWYSAAQATVKEPRYSYLETALISQMLRLNYSYNSRYLLTLTGRRDGYSGFGAKTKWGIFPSAALGWNVAMENFFPWKNMVNELKMKVSYGLNGNQAIGAYQTITRLSDASYVDGTKILAGYAPSKLGVDNLGWESTKSLNLGIDFGLLSSRISGDVSYYQSNTFDLLLDRTISAVHGITSITQNIGKTENKGLEASVVSRNIAKKDFQWVTYANVTFVKNKIVSLYGQLDENGNEIDDVANKWFIGQPIKVNYGYVWEGVWQSDEAEEAALYNTQPGYIKIKDADGVTGITVDDRQIAGQQDPKFLWGMTNTWSYKNLSLSVFVHGVHGVTKENLLLIDFMRASADCRRNVSNRVFWTPENPTTKIPINKVNSWLEQGLSPMPLENAGFIRVKDITLSYDLAKSLLNRAGFSKLQLYVTGRNLFTITKWTGLDPELDGQRSIPLQKEFVFGLNLGF